MNNKTKNELKNETLNIDSSNCEEVSKINLKTKNKEENYEDCSLSFISGIGEKNDLYTEDERINGKNEDEIGELVKNMKVYDKSKQKKYIQEITKLDNFLFTNTVFSTNVTDKVYRNENEKEKKEIFFMNKKTKRK